MTKISLNRHRNVLICLLLTTAVLVVYWQVQNFDFIDYDDNIYVIENTHIQTGLTFQNIAWAFRDTHVGHWHPLTWFSHMLDWRLFRANPGGHHWTSIILHVANTLLLFLVFKRMTAEVWKNAFIAALFGVHPLNVESVVWIAERKNVLSMFFLIVTIWVYVFYVEQQEFKRYLLVLLSFALGLMAKPIIVTLPFLLLLLDYWPLNRFPSEKSGDNGRLQNKKFLGLSVFRLILEKIPLFALSAISCIVTLFAARSAGAMKSLDVFPLEIRIANAFISYMRYIEKMFWPHDLSVFYPYQGVFPVWQVALTGLTFSCVTILVFWAARRYPYLAVGWLWYLGTLLPVIGLVQVGFQAMADRYAYLPLIGLFIIIAFGIPDLSSGWRWRRVISATSAGVIIPVFMICTWLSVQHWQNSTTVFQHALNVTRNNHIAHLGMGNVFLNQGNPDRAAAHYRRALQIKPDYAEAHNNLGIIAMRKKNFAEAVHYYHEALRIDPHFVKAYNNIGVILAYQGKIGDAIAHFRAALRVDPDYGGAKSNMSKVLEAQLNKSFRN